MAAFLYFGFRTEPGAGHTLTHSHYKSNAKFFPVNRFNTGHVPEKTCLVFCGFFLNTSSRPCSSK
ncbi:hypothetical protein P4O66_005365, partial [Electrophorus voltai]